MRDLLRVAIVITVS